MDFISLFYLILNNIEMATIIRCTCCGEFVGQDKKVFVQTMNKDPKKDDLRYIIGCTVSDFGFPTLKGMNFIPVCDILQTKSMGINPEGTRVCYSVYCNPCFIALTTSYIIYETDHNMLILEQFMTYEQYITLILAASNTIEQPMDG